MKTTSHTPEPWIAKLGRYDFDNDGGRPIMGGNPDDETYRRVAMVDSIIEHNRKTPYDATDEERDANARLIAAAPDLLEALEQLLAKVECGTALQCELCDKARATIAKAKGEQ